MNPPPYEDAAALPWRIVQLERKTDALDKEMDLKASRDEVADLRKLMYWVIGAMFTLTITIAAAAITFALTAGGAT